MALNLVLAALAALLVVVGVVSRLAKEASPVCPLNPISQIGIPFVFPPFPFKSAPPDPPGRRVLAISAILWYHTLRSPFRTGGVP